jgi:uncharacterized repeat protein (TIGR01451 family)
MKLTQLVALPMALAALLAVPAAAGAANGPDLRVSIADAPDPVAPGADITYTIDLTNQGNAVAQNVSLKDTLPAGTTYVHASEPGGWALAHPALGSGGSMVVTKSSLAAGAHAQFTLTVKVDPSTAAGTTITDHATASTSSGDVVTRNNVDTTTTTVERADAIVALSDLPDPVGPDRDLSYVVLLANHGKVPAQSVTVATQVPPGTTFVSASAPAGWTVTAPPVGGAGQVTFATTSLPPQFGLFLSLKVHVDPSAAEGSTISNVASVATSTPESDTTNNSASSDTLVSSRADIQPVLFDPPATVDPDTDLKYTVGAINAAPGVADDVSLSAAIPTGTTFVSVAQTHGPPMSCTPGPTALTCSGALLAQNEYVTFDLVVHVSPGAAGSKLDETVAAATSSAELDSANNSVTKSSAVTGTATKPPPGGGTADLALRATRAGKKLKRTLTYKVRNKGDATASGSRLRVTLAKKLQLKKKPKACTLKKRVVKCPLGDLAPNALAKVKLVVQAKKAGKFKVKARALESAADSNPANDLRSFTLRLH